MNAPMTVKMTGSAFAIVHAFMLDIPGQAFPDIVNATIVGNDRGERWLGALVVTNGADESTSYYGAPITDPAARRVIRACGLDDLA